MKPKHFASTIALTLSAGPAVHAASDSWTGLNDSLWSTAGNWTSATTVPGAGETATFDGVGNGNTTIDLEAGVAVGAIVFDTTNAAAYVIGSGAAGSQTLTLGTTGNAITMHSDVANHQAINANLALTVTRTVGNASTYYAVANNSPANTLTLAGGISASSAGVKVLNPTGGGNTAISGAISSGSGNVSVFKTGSGTLTLSGGGTFSGVGVRDGANFDSSAVFREGTTILNGGTYGNSAGELVIGGVATHGGAGTNTTLQLETGTTLNGINWLSVGRGNGNGTATSNLTLNGNASIASDNLSAGFNAGNAANIPKGAITLNGTSNYSTNTGGRFFLAESASSDFTMTLNDSSSVILAGDAGAPDRRIVGGPGGTGTLTLNGSAAFTDNATTNSFNVGYQNGHGTLNVNAGTTFTTGAEIRVAASNTNGIFGGSGAIHVNGGTLNMNALTLARNNNDAASTLSATVNVSSGTVNVKAGQSLIGWRGTSSSGALAISGGTFNQGTTAAANMTIGSFAGATGSVGVSGSGELNLQNNSSLRFSDVANANATRTLAISGGTVTFFSDAGTTEGGTGFIDLMVTSNPAGTSTIHLDGGTLTANQIKATSATGTRVINFNGGTLKVADVGFSATFLAAGVATTANIRNGGAIIDTNGYNVTIGQTLTHSAIGGDNPIDGGLTVNATGTLTLTGDNTYTGDTTVNGGVLATDGTAIPDDGKLVIDGGKVDPMGNTEVVDTLFFGSQQQSAGTYSADPLSGADFIDNIHFAGTGIVSVTTGPSAGNTYDDWADANAPTQTIDQDHDGDGVPNGIEYFMGLSGSSFTANPAPTSGTVTWPMGQDYAGVYGTDYEVQFSTTLVTWTKVNEGSGDNTVTVTPGASVVYDMPSGGRLFVRLIVNN